MTNELAGMTWQTWAGLPDREKNRLRDNSCLIPQLIPYEGDRVEVTTLDGCVTRFWVGKSTGWRPCHLEILKSNSSGGCSVNFPAGSTVKLIRKGPRR